MALSATNAISPTVRGVLWADAGLELLVAAVLIGFPGPAEDWLHLHPAVSLSLAGIFLAAGIALAAAAQSRRTIGAFVRFLAWANIAGGTAVWLLLLDAWGYFPAEGRWMLAAAGDSFIVIGILELIALRRMARG